LSRGSSLASRGHRDHPGAPAAIPHPARPGSGTSLTGTSLRARGGRNIGHPADVAGAGG
jgi:hypothetical protein